MITRRIIALVIAVTVGAITIRNGASQPSTDSDDENYIGWRLSDKIVLSGPFTGLARLREQMSGTEIESASELENLSGEGGEPTQLMAALVKALSELEAGRIETTKSTIHVMGVSSNPDKAKKLISEQLPTGKRTLITEIEGLPNAPSTWIARRAWSELELIGGLASESERAQLIALTKSLGVTTVIDRMTVSPTAINGFTEAAIRSAVAQVGLLQTGIISVFNKIIDIVGVGFFESDPRTLCSSLIETLPEGFRCGLIKVVKEPPRTAYVPRRREGRTSRLIKPIPGLKPSTAVPPSAIKPDMSTQPFSDPRSVDILFATTRNIEVEGPIARFSGERSERLSFGAARVHVPKHHKIGRLELPNGYAIFSFFGRRQPDPDTNFVLQSAELLTPDRWNTLIDKAERDEALVFVHGFNTPFDYALFRLAQIVYDLQYKGLPVLFSWASRGDGDVAGILNYAYDKESAILARKKFIEVLTNLQQKHRISRVHIIAHSMGNFVVLDALANTANWRNKLGELIMAAPDVDIDQFVQEIPLIQHLFRGLTLYASSADKAMMASKRVAVKVRAGDVSADGPIILPGVESIDVTALGEEVLGLNHTTFAESRPLMNDIKILLSDGRRAPRLIDVRPFPEDRPPPPSYWRFAPY